jgi:DNA-binding MarR family transcriptional regulator
LPRVWLTDKGRQLVQSLLPTHADHVSELLSALDAGERRELRRLLGKLRDALHARNARKQA